MYENMSSLLESAKHHAAAWLELIADRPVRATLSGDELRQILGGPLPHEGIDAEVLTGTLANAALGERLPLRVLDISVLSWAAAFLPHSRQIGLCRPGIKMPAFTPCLHWSR